MVQAYREQDPELQVAEQKKSLTLSVIICAYTEERWDDLLAVVAAIRAQTLAPDEVIVVIDHNPRLFARSQAQFQGLDRPPVRLLENQEQRGLSGARNTGIAAAGGEVLAFIDEDAVPESDWLERLSQCYQDGQVIGAGGAIEPVWEGGRPAWFPREFDWVVGCTYLGMPELVSPVRNLIGCNMSFRREVFERSGGFLSGMGRIGKYPAGCEETELCIRASQEMRQGLFVYQPAARVRHRVPAARRGWAYFRARCYAEGLSKALVTRAVGSQAGLASERAYTLRTLPRGFFLGLGDALWRKDFSGLARAAAIFAGLTITGAGYLRGRVWGSARYDRQSPRQLPRENGD